MARISISIPDTLMTKLEPIKDGINISQLCREALERRVAAFERAAGHEALDLEGLVKRLRDERAGEESNFEDLGKDNAGRWLNTVSYLELKNVAENPSSSNMSKYKLPRAAFQTMKQDMAQASVSFEGAQAVAYKTAWLDYVRSVWVQVVNQIESSNHNQNGGAQIESSNHSQTVEAQPESAS